MVFKFIVHTIRGQPDSLKQPIKIAFTLTPCDSRRPTCPYNPVARGVTHFPVDREHSSCLEWDLVFGFSSCIVRGRTYTLEPGYSSDVIPPGHFVTLTAPGGVQTWSTPAPYNDHVAFRQFSVMGVNGAGSSQSVGLLILSPSDSRRWNSVIYHTRNDDNIIAPTELMLQVYVVADNIELRSVLSPEDLKQPLFPTPIKCDSLPNVSMWTLCQDKTGKIELHSDSRANFNGFPAEVGNDILMNSISEVKDQLSALEKNIESGQQAIVVMQTQLSELTQYPQKPPVSQPPHVTNDKPASDLGEKVADLQRKTEELTKAYSQTQEYFTSVHKFLQATTQRVAVLDQKLPAVEAEMGKSLAALNDRMTTVEGNSAKLLERLEGVRDSVAHLIGDESAVVFPNQRHALSPPPFSPSTIDELPKPPSFTLS